jgi:hypothetical protein
MDWVREQLDEQLTALKGLWANKRQVRDTCQVSFTARRARVRGAVLSGVPASLTYPACSSCPCPACPVVMPPCPQMAFQVLNLAMIVFSALMIWKALMFFTHSESPVVVVLR